IHLTVPMLFALAFIVTFVNGGLTGLFLGNVVVDVPLSDTMFVVAHFHMVMGVAPILVVLGAIYHWYPKVTGRMLNDGLGKFHFWVTFLRSEEHTSELQSRSDLVCRLLLEKKKKKEINHQSHHTFVNFS